MITACRFLPRRHPGAQHGLRLAALVAGRPARVDVGGVDEVAAGLDVGVEHRLRRLLVRRPAERVAAETERGDLQPGATERCASACLPFLLGHYSTASGPSQPAAGARSGPPLDPAAPPLTTIAVAPAIAQRTPFAKLTASLDRRTCVVVSPPLAGRPSSIPDVRLMDRLRAAFARAHVENADWAWRSESHRQPSDRTVMPSPGGVRRARRHAGRSRGRRPAGPRE